MAKNEIEHYKKRLIKQFHEADKQISIISTSILLEPFIVKYKGRTQKFQMEIKLNQLIGK